jgi:hypothetical protein
VLGEALCGTIKIRVDLLLSDCTTPLNRTDLVISSDKGNRSSRRYRSVFGDTCAVWGRGSSVELSFEGAISDIFNSHPIGGLDRFITTYIHDSTTQTPTAIRRLELPNTLSYHTHNLPPCLGESPPPYLPRLAESSQPPPGRISHRQSAQQHPQYLLSGGASTTRKISRSFCEMRMRADGWR